MHSPPLGYLVMPARLQGTDFKELKKEGTWLKKKKGGEAKTKTSLKSISSLDLGFKVFLIFAPSFVYRCLDEWYINIQQTYLWASRQWQCRFPQLTLVTEKCSQVLWFSQERYRVRKVVLHPKKYIVLANRQNIEKANPSYNYLSPKIFEGNIYFINNTIYNYFLKMKVLLLAFILFQLEWIFNMNNRKWNYFPSFHSQCTPKAFFFL